MNTDKLALLRQMLMDMVEYPKDLESVYAQALAEAIAELEAYND